MKRIRWFNSFFAVVLVMALMIPGRAFAENTANAGKELRLTVHFENEGKPVSGIEFSLYLVATGNSSSKLTLTKQFSSYPVKLPSGTSGDWYSIASTLEGYVLWDKLKPLCTSVTIQEGYAAFPTGGKKLVQGCYLILAKPFTRDGLYFEPAPILVMLPETDPESKEPIYDGIVEAKFSVTEAGDEPAPVSLQVLKCWNDKEYDKKRPSNVVVQLLKNGEIYDEVTLNEDNNWRHTWKELEGNTRYNIVEKDISDYTVEVVRDGEVFVVSNTYSGKLPENPKPGNTGSLPQTGQLWWPVPVLVALGLLLIVAGLLRRKGKENE